MPPLRRRQMRMHSQRRQQQTSTLVSTLLLCDRSRSPSRRLRFRRYLDNSFFEHQIHSFSILNSFMMVRLGLAELSSIGQVIFLVGLVTLILLRTLRQAACRAEQA